MTLSVDTDVPVGSLPPQVLGDATMCYSLMVNLLKNACEAAPQGSRVQVQLFSEDPLRVTITNSGVVPAAIRPSFFDKYVTSGKPGALGLGTYSARLLARAQSGDVALAVDDAAQTTCVTVTLPVVPSAAGAPAA